MVYLLICNDFQAPQRIGIEAYIDTLSVVSLPLSACLGFRI